MSTRFRWAARILSLLFVAFLSLFALDIFEMYQGWAVVLPLLTHLIPSFVLLAFVLVAWRYDLVGAAGFILFAAWYVWQAGPGVPWTWYAFIAGPALITGLLYLAGWLARKRGG